MSRRFVTLDVFTTRPHAGNPLAVVLDSEGLDTAAMQTIAREFNLSETVFVAPPANPAHRAAIRIFTPGQELPFAGHPTVGTTALLALRDAAEGRPADQLVLEEKVGLVPCVIALGNARSARATFTLPKLPEQIVQPITEAALAEAVGLELTDLGFDTHRPSAFSAGVAYTMVPVAGREAVAKARVAGAFERVMAPAQNGNAFIYCRETEEAGHHYHARMFWPEAGVTEDPATGSAVAAFAGAIMAFDRPGDGTHRLVIEQGYEMGRPSQIELTLTVAGGALASATIGGGAVVMSEGVLL
ncbi:putative enzyme [Bosea sp. 62]|uniref:PhzF family phenazine biosynthesis protein n=1 Tax=unclassified Bosea (in: a-proteobacteria) TaxID=2653178 RepID=UPI001257E80A|nr:MULTISPECIES: PhzF family phenazine biosynthesis protein [unclassified Bosea (in: a-proteobacteria)]CAD5246311.1 putative enzyme [Bosea sp. 21B]CAD5247570.1 putative enzyme [Bosea sp. 7B]CAD5268924.1 putative enzyme [Bosea sp. 46]VVT50555.1 putative enzyme [Bosea sp. EC-HK365B]VXA99751.1 putative enzyme [Bosea sp. 127]